MSYAPIRMIQIKSEEGKDRVRWERKEITVGGRERREITITLPLYQRLINLSLLELRWAGLMPRAPPLSVLSSPFHPAPLAHFALFLVSGLDFLTLTTHLLLSLSLSLGSSHSTL